MQTIDEYASSRNMRENSKIRNERSAAQIALLLYRYRTVSWCQENIKLHITLSHEDLKSGINWMRRKKYISGQSVVFLTMTGIEFVEGLFRNSRLSSSASESRFKSEVLTGVRETKSKASGYMVSERSTLTAAALPRPSKPQTKETPEDEMIKRQKALHSKEKLAKEFKISKSELERHIETGRVRYCKSCDSVQLFDRKTFNRWHSVCKKCRKSHAQ